MTVRSRRKLCAGDRQSVSHMRKICWRQIGGQTAVTIYSEIRAYFTQPAQPAQPASQRSRINHFLYMTKRARAHRWNTHHIAVSVARA